MQNGGARVFPADWRNESAQPRVGVQDCEEVLKF
jgi:hypothetical protein